MTDIRRTVRRVTVIDGIDIPLTLIPNTNSTTSSPTAKLIPVSIGQNYVTYDVVFLYNDEAPTEEIQFTIISNLISIGEDINEQPLIALDSLGIIDIHTRYVAKDKVVTNLLLTATI